MAFTLTSPSLGGDLFPPLAWRGAPAGTQSFVLLCHDPDGGDWTHWLRYDLPASLLSLPGGAEGDWGTLIRSDPGPLIWGDPGPPPRRRLFDLYAVDIPALGLPLGADREAVEAAMEGHLLSRARLLIPESPQKEPRP